MDLNYHIINDLHKEKTRLEKLKANALRTIKNAPEGTVLIKLCNNTPQFYQRTAPKDKCGSYIPVAERDKAVQLVQKRYLERLCDAAEKQLKAIDRFLQQYDRDALKKVFISENETRRRFIIPAELPDEIYFPLWQAYEYERKGFLEGDKQHFSKKHERVRSKSEAMIADALYAAGIPYRYECPLEVNRRTIHPDFTILRPYDRKIFYWEHLGKIDDAAYMKRNFFRIRDYESDGIFPGDQLILTGETEEMPLNNIIIEQVIRHYLLPNE